jgi:L-fuculose-phosphate aldolase
MPTPSTHAAAIVAICRRLYERGYVVATEGNVSVRLDSGEILITGTRVSKRSITRADLVTMSAGGRKRSGRVEPSSESKLHAFIYSKRRDVRSIVHAHPPYCTAFAVARVPLPVDAIPEVAVEFGRIPLVPFAVPSTGRLTEAFAPFAGEGDFFLLANHGVVACGRDVEEAFEKIERAEHAARIILLARLLGGERRLAARDLRELERIGQRRKR